MRSAGHVFLDRAEKKFRGSPALGLRKKPRPMLFTSKLPARFLPQKCPFFTGNLLVIYLIIILY